MNPNQLLHGDSSIPEQTEGLQELKWAFFPGGSTSPESMVRNGVASSTTLPVEPTLYIEGKEISAEAPTSATILKFPVRDVIDELSLPQSTDARARLVARAAVEVPLERLLAHAAASDDVLLLGALCEILGTIGRRKNEAAVTPVLLSLAGHQHPSVRYAAAEALGRLKGTPEILERLRAMAENDENPGVRTEAREVLDDLSE